MNSIVSWLRRQPLLGFVALTYGISWCGIVIDPQRTVA